MWSENGEGDPIDHYQADNEQDEAEWLGKTVADLNQSRACAYKDMAVLVRTNEQTRIYEEELRRRHIPCRVAGGRGFYDRKEVRDLMGYLFFISNPLDEMSLTRILKVPLRVVHRETLKTIEERAGRSQWSLWEAFQTLDALDIAAPQKENIARFTDLIKRYMALFGRGDLAAPFRQMVAELKYREYIEIMYKDRKEEIEKRLAVVNELEHSLDLFEQRQKKHDLATYLQDVLLMLREKEEETHRDAVSLMTLHSSKGMEYPVVFLPGLDDEVMPSKRSVAEGNIEEERRLFYVGMTRAQKQLFFSWPSTRFLYNKHRPVNHCRFIQDIPTDLLAAPIGKREAELREKVFSKFFKEMKERFRVA